ncbi:MAG: hypothetical protein HOD17_13850 [Desulfobacteraceae bacterium]|nr:hypothetical protein [Desulfobacteraceae bacterium]
METLLIPLRMFFQGDDNSYRYFQGVLNPILILFAPFILLNREYIRDKLYFAGFCIFFIFISYFTTLKQVRYILPVIPFLVILSVFGIKNLMEILNKDSLLYFKEMKSRTANLFKVLLYVVIVSLFMQNILYLKKRIDIIKPFSYLLKDENREEFLKRNLKYYYAVEYVNTKLPVDSKIFLMFLGRRSYYLDRPFRHEPSFGRSTLSNLVDKSKDIEGFKKATRSIGTTHILMRNALADKYLHDMYPKEHITRLMDKIRNNWKLVYQGEGYSVFDIQIK